MARHRIFSVSFASIYPHYVAKAARKGRGKDEVDQVIGWLTGYDAAGLDRVIAAEVDLETFFAQAPAFTPHASQITGVICGHRVEDIEDPLMQRIRYLDKLVDELARGKKMSAILRGGDTAGQPAGPDRPSRAATGSGGRQAVKTVENDADVTAFLADVEHDVRRRDAATLVELLGRVTGEPPRMWGPSIVGFGRHHYRYATGREGDTAALGFSPRKASTTVYLVDGFDAHGDLLERLGPHTTGRSCLYLKDLATVDLPVLEDLLRRSWAATTGARRSPGDAA